MTKNRFTSLSVNRRQFGAGLLGTAALISAAPRMAWSATAEPKRGGVLRVATHVQSANDTFDPAKFTFSNDYIRGTTFYNTLTVPNENNEPQPELAESWEADATGKNWTFKLRKGITFHDGSSMTAQDVVFSIMRHKVEETASSARPLVANITGVDIDNADTIVVRLESPDADLPNLMGIFQFAILKDGTTDFAKPNGTGPFTLKEFKPGVRTVGVRNGNYWKEGRPYVDEIELFYITDPIARLNALLAGDAHMVSELRGTAIDEVSKSETTKLFTATAPRYSFIRGVVDIPPADNEDLRLVFAHLVNRKRFVETVLKGKASLGNDHPFLGTSPLYNADIPQRELDHDKAKFHLQKSGIGSGKVEFHVSDAAPYGLELGQLLQREAAAIGFNMDLRREPADSYWNTIAGKRAFFIDAHSPRPTYNIMLTLFWKSTAPWNHSHFKDEKLDKLIDEGRSTLDLAKRKEIYGAAQRIIHDSASSIIPAFMDYVDGVANSVQGLVPGPLGNFGGFNFADKVWLDS